MIIINKKYTNAFLACALISASGMSFANEQVRWRVPLAAPASTAVVGQMPQYLAEQLEKISGGEIRFMLQDPGKIVPAFGIFDALKEGKIDAGYQWIGYDQGKVPAAALLGGAPFGMEPMEYSMWYYDRGGKDLIRDVYAPHNIVPLLCGVSGPETAGWFREEISSLEDIQGLKIRASGLAGKVYEELGASVTVLPAGELFQALEMGVLDATEFSIPPMDKSLGFYQIAKYNYFPGWHQNSAAHYLMVNKNSWDGLEDSTKSSLELACQATNVMAMIYGDAPSGEIIEEFKAEGVITGELPEEMLISLREVSYEVLEREANNDEDFARLLDSQAEFMTSYETWKHLGYLPRDMESIFTFKNDD